MIRSLVFTTQGRLHSRNIEMFLMPTLLSDTNLFLWVDLENATPEEAKYVLEEVFHFHPLSIEDCIAESPSPKVEDYSPKEEDKFTPYLFIVIHAVDYSRKDGVFATRELDFFLGKNYLVTYHTGPLKSVTLTEERAVKGTMHLARAPDRVASRDLTCATAASDSTAEPPSMTCGSWRPLPPKRSGFLHSRGDGALE